MYAGVWDPSLPTPSYSARLTGQILILAYGVEAAEKCKQLDVQAAFLNVVVLIGAYVGDASSEFHELALVAYGKLVELRATVHHPKPAGYSVWLAEVFLSEYDDPHAFLTSEVDKHKQWCNELKPLLAR